MKLSRTSAGTVENLEALRDTDGTGVLPLQVRVTGGASFVVNGRVAPDAPWIEIASGSADILESITWLPHVQLVQTGTGAVDLWIADK